MGEKKYKASFAYGSDIKSKKIGDYHSLDEAISACIEFADNQHEFINHAEHKTAINALEKRGFYCVGYSTLILYVE